MISDLRKIGKVGLNPLQTSFENTKSFSANRLGLLTIVKPLEPSAYRLFRESNREEQEQVGGLPTSSATRNELAPSHMHRSIYYRQMVPIWMPAL